MQNGQTATVTGSQGLLVAKYETRSYLRGEMRWFVYRNWNDNRNREGFELDRFDTLEEAVAYMREHERKHTVLVFHQHEAVPDSLFGVDNLEGRRREVHGCDVPNWGSGWWTFDSDGRLTYFRGNWDSSD